MQPKMDKNFLFILLFLFFKICHKYNKNNSNRDYFLKKML